MIAGNNKSGGIRWLQQLRGVTLIRDISIFLLFPTCLISITVLLHSWSSGSQNSKLQTFLYSILSRKLKSEGKTRKKCILLYIYYPVHTAKFMYILSNL